MEGAAPAPAPAPASSPGAEPEMSDAMELKEQAGVAFAKKDYTTAANVYTQALEALGTAVTDEGIALNVILHSNVAEACLRLKRWQAAAEHAEQALQLDPAHAKSIRRLSTARERLAASSVAREALPQESESAPAVADIDWLAVKLELQSLRPSELRRQACSLGAPPGELDLADDADDPRNAMIDLVVHLKQMAAIMASEAPPLDVPPLTSHDHLVARKSREARAEALLSSEPEPEPAPELLDRPAAQIQEQVDDVGEPTTWEQWAEECEDTPDPPPRFDLLADDLLALVLAQFCTGGEVEEVYEANRAALTMACLSKPYRRVCYQLGKDRAALSPLLYRASERYWQARRWAQEAKHLGGLQAGSPQHAHWCALSAQCAPGERKHFAAYQEEKRQLEMMSSIADHLARCCGNESCTRRPRPSPHAGIVLSQAQRLAFAEATYGRPPTQQQWLLREGYIHACLDSDSAPPKLHSCGRCGLDGYCDRRCQKAAWKTHKDHCVKKASQLDRDRRVTLIQGLCKMWTESLTDPFQLLEDSDIDLLAASPQFLELGIARSVDNLLGLPEGAWGAIPSSPQCFPFALRWFCTQPAFGVTMDNPQRVMSDLHLEKPSSWEETQKGFLNVVGAPCMIPCEMISGTSELMSLAIRRLYGLPDFADEEYFVRGIENTPYSTLVGDEETFVDAMFPLAKSVLEHKLLFLGGEIR